MGPGIPGDGKNRAVPQRKTRPGQIGRNQPVKTQPWPNRPKSRPGGSPSFFLLSSFLGIYATTTTTFFYRIRISIKSLPRGAFNIMRVEVVVVLVVGRGGWGYVGGSTANRQ